MFVSEWNSMEIYILIKIIGASFLELKVIYRPVLIIPISSAIAEKSFSTLKRIKTYN